MMNEFTEGNEQTHPEFGMTRRVSTHVFLFIMLFMRRIFMNNFFIWDGLLVGYLLVRHFFWGLCYEWFILQFAQSLVGGLWLQGSLHDMRCESQKKQN